MEERGYTVIACLAQGSQGRVYEVRDSDGRPRVVKQLPWVNDVVRAEAMREVRLLSSLRHPCIVPYLENFLMRSVPSLPTEDTLCLVMSRCEHDLRQECERRRLEGIPVDETKALLWFAQLCWGLHHLHSRKFLHRDLKPQNVLLTQSGRLLLSDFGVACHLERTEDLRSTRVGTLAFMSPEMLDGRPYGRKSDQWALGCVLFEILVLEPPFVRCALPSAVRNAVSEILRTRLPPTYSKELRGAVRALLANNPDERPANSDLLRGPLLRNSFQSFVQHLELSAATADGRGVDAGAELSPPHGNALRLHGRLTGNMHDFLHGMLPSPPEGESPRGSAPGAPPGPGPRKSQYFPLVGAVPEDKPPDLFGQSLRSWYQTDAELSSELEKYLNEPPLCEFRDYPDLRAPPQVSTLTALGAEDTTTGWSCFDSDAGSECEHEQTFAIDNAGLGACEWRQLLDEAETLLEVKPEASPSSAADEVGKVRKSLAKVLGSEAQVDRALRFLRERQPLGDSEEADEILLQVEILDYIGDEGVHALPLLERCLKLEAAMLGGC